MNVGLEFGVLNNRISGSIEYFDRGSSELLFSVPQGLSAPVTVKNENIGTMWNRGIEAELNFEVVNTKNVNWDVQLNITSLKNKITKLPETTPTIVSGTKRLEAGQDIFAFYLRRWYGVDPADGAGLFYALLVLHQIIVLQRKEIRLPPILPMQHSIMPDLRFLNSSGLFQVRLL